MNKKLKAGFILSWALIILFCFVFGLLIRGTFWTPDYETLIREDIPLAFDDATETDAFYQKYVLSNQSAGDIVTELLENSDIVIRAGYSGARALERNATLTTVEIDEVIKGDQSLSGKRIFVYEESFFLLNGRQAIFYLVDGNNLLRSGERYILFLNHKEFPEQYHQSEKERLTYVMLQGPFSKFNITNNASSSEQAEDTNSLDNALYFNQMMDTDFLIADLDLISVYLCVKDTILLRYQ